MSRGHIPIRTCVVCGRKGPRASLLRLALDPESKTIVPDHCKRMPGRGAHVCPSCLPRLRFTKRVQKAFRNEAKSKISL